MNDQIALDIIFAWTILVLLFYSVSDGRRISKLEDYVKWLEKHLNRD